MKRRRMMMLFAVMLSAFAWHPVIAEENKSKSAESVDKGKSADKNGSVIFYRTRSAKGAAIRLNIEGGDKGTVGHLTNGSKIVKEMPAGEFTFVVTSPSIAGRDSVTINIEAGKTYYIKGEAKLGWPAARARFTLMDEAKGKAEADKIK